MKRLPVIGFMALAMVVSATLIWQSPDVANAFEWCSSHPAGYYLCWTNDTYYDYGNGQWGGTSLTETDFPITSIDYIFARSRGTRVCNGFEYQHWNNATDSYDTSIAGNSGDHAFTSQGCNGDWDGLYHESHHLWNDAGDGVDEERLETVVDLFNTSQCPPPYKCT